MAWMPRYERIIASCDAATPIGFRDRAVILPLARPPKYWVSRATFALRNSMMLTV
jgi:hypothetical protein